VEQGKLLHGHAYTKAKCRMGRHARLRHHRPLAPTPCTHTSSPPSHALLVEFDKVDACHCSRMHWGRRGRAGARGQPRRSEVPTTPIYRKTRTELPTPSRTPPCAAEAVGVAERACMRNMKRLVEHRHALFACACGEARQEEGKGEGWGSRISNRMATRTRTRSWGRARQVDVVKGARGGTRGSHLRVCEHESGGRTTHTETKGDHAGKKADLNQNLVKSTKNCANSHPCRYILRPFRSKLHPDSCIPRAKKSHHISGVVCASGGCVA
jgi:hypothetical protein